MKAVASGPGAENGLPGTDPDQDSGDETGEAAVDQPAEAVTLGLDEIFETLKNERRRMVLRYLEDHEEPVSLGELAEYVAAEENDTTVAQVTSKERKCAYVGLYQCHLPKMNDMDVVEFNKNRGRVASGKNMAAVREYLTPAETTERPWPLYYGALAFAGILAVGTVQLLAGLASVGLAVSVLLLAGIAALATFQLRVDAASDEEQSASP